MATALTDEWTEEKVIQLIKEFRIRPVLWDPKDPLFFKNCMKPKAWEEIGDILNISPDKCKNKMMILMSSFRREKSKIMHSLREIPDPSQAYKSTWFAFKYMVFLMDKDNERKRQFINSSDTSSSATTVADDETNMLIDINPPSPKKRCRLTRFEKLMAKKVAATILSEEVNKAKSLATPGLSQTPATPGPSQTPADEEIQSFMSFIGNKMKKCSDTTKNSMQQAICDVIFKADQNYYEPTNSYDKFTIIDDDTDPLNRSMYDVQSGTAIKVQNDSEDSE